ncbi:hypothetical protein [Chitinophaga pinensis]|uniref:hypothetical protein n=1 Tax=Chitinophaga pinensis TaxID=79329 RepID=UPI001646BB9E|nr:hypothetical protein [Chitinophaga pinensis]
MPRWAGVNPADGKPQWIDSTGKVTSDYNAALPEFVGNSQQMDLVLLPIRFL